MADLKGSALVILAEGAEEMEAVITTDVLRRGKVSWYSKISFSKYFTGQCGLLLKEGSVMYHVTLTVPGS